MIYTCYIIIVHDTQNIFRTFTLNLSIFALVILCFCFPAYRGVYTRQRFFYLKPTGLSWT
uniref:Uncharacterized protein n=1 Tax=Myoviridae sp. ctZgq1 TaxID=2826666 RepID=A0A8S5LXG2_9CAUD|nr:MAG TPA: hypothetical protein [Myoviridae sp. ctZgq1]